MIYSKDSLIAKLQDIKARGWIENTKRNKNHGAIGNLLEDLLGIKENNLPLPNTGEWELKTWRRASTSLLTLFHVEPSPTALKFVPSILLPLYGWPHQEAGKKHTSAEMSFRQTIYTTKYSDRGFKVVLDDEKQHVKISFNVNTVSVQHSEWLNSVKERVGLGELNPQPYWGYDDLGHKAGAKLTNVFLVGANRKTTNENGIQRELFYYDSCLMLSHFSAKRFLNLLAEGAIYVDFDARTGHNHGTKFRIRNNRLPDLYDNVAEVF
jgi:hypothetical protein